MRAPTTGVCPRPCRGAHCAPVEYREIFFDAGQSATAGLFSAKYRAIIFYVGFTDRHGADLTPFQLGIKPKGGESHAESSLVDFRRLHRGLCAAGDAL